MIAKRMYDFVEFVHMKDGQNGEGGCDTSMKSKGTMTNSHCPGKRVRLEFLTPPATPRCRQWQWREEEAKSVEVMDNEEMVCRKLNSMYMKEHLDCLTFLCQQFIKHDNSIDNLKMAVENCQNTMKLMDSNVDVNLLFANLETLKDIYVCYKTVLKSKKKYIDYFLTDNDACMQIDNHECWCVWVNKLASKQAKNENSFMYML